MKKHSHRWALIPVSGGVKRHCFGCNTTQQLVTATKWAVCETMHFFGIDPKTGELANRKSTSL